MMISKQTKKWIGLAVTCVFTSVAYNNCGNFSSGGEGTQLSSLGADTTEIVPLPNTKTAAVIRGSRALDNLVSCLGTVQPSAASAAEWNRNRATISEEGLANSVTQPMVKALVGLSAEVCNDLIQRERALQPTARRIFAEVNFDAGGVTNQAVSLAARRLARSCWGRNPSSEELSSISSSLNNTFQGADDNAQATRNKMSFLCTAVAASFATYEM